MADHSCPGTLRSGLNDSDLNSETKKFDTISSASTVMKRFGLTITWHSSGIRVAVSELPVSRAPMDAASTVHWLETRGEWEVFCLEIYRRIQPSTLLDMSQKK